MSTSPRDVILDVYAAFGRGDIPAVLARIAPDATWGYDGPGLDDILWLRRGTGRDTAIGYFTGVAQTMDIKHFEPIAVAADGDRVLGLIRIDAVIRPTGKRLATTEVHAFRVRDGLIVDYRPVIDGLAFSTAFSPA